MFALRLITTYEFILLYDIIIKCSS